VSSAEGRRYGGRTGEERRAERRARLRATALEVFGTVGFQSSTIEQICADAKVATRNFYEEFESKEALLIDLHDEVNARAFEAVGAVLDRIDPSDVEERARAGFDAYLEVMATDPRWARIAFVEMIGATPATFAARRAALERFAGLIEAEAERLVALQLIPPGDYALKATAIVGAFTALVETWTGEGDQERHLRRVADEATAILLLVLSGGSITHQAHGRR
jgi:AcrR family transcriptional regulator